MTTAPITTPATQSAPPKTVRVLSWNLAHRVRTWQRVVELAAAHEVDVALVREATRPGQGAPTGLQTWPSTSDRTAWHA